MSGVQSDYWESVRTWEYTHHSVKVWFYGNDTPVSVEDQLNRMGKQGWELVCITEGIGLFKREIRG